MRTEEFNNFYTIYDYPLNCLVACRNVKPINIQLHCMDKLNSTLAMPGR
jgi:hypothetical protein